MLPISTDGCLNSDGTPYPQIALENTFGLGDKMAIESNFTVYETEEASGLLSFYHISYHYIGMVGYLVSLRSSSSRVSEMSSNNQNISNLKFHVQSLKTRQFLTL